MNESPLGFAWPDSKERFARLKEAAELMRLLWTEDRVSYDGSFYRLNRATIYDRPPEPVPLYIAASGPSAARLAGRVADGFICTSGKGMDLYAESLIPSVFDAAAQQGRVARDIELTIEMKVSFDTDHTRALEDTRHWAALALPADTKVGIEDPLEMERIANELPTATAASRWIVSTDPEEHVARIQPYLDLGFTHLVFHAPGPDQIRFIQLYSREVLPRLRRNT